uniref:Uncharacterized protein n=1 Tax=Zea mays TaxID=4577 RepID=C4J0U3_MAIZE|nr:unknown [Zea mays]
MVTMCMDAADRVHRQVVRAGAELHPHPQRPHRCRSLLPRLGSRPPPDHQHVPALPSPAGVGGLPDLAAPCTASARRESQRRLPHQHRCRRRHVFRHVPLPGLRGARAALLPGAGHHPVRGARRALLAPDHRRRRRGARAHTGAGLPQADVRAAAVGVLRQLRPLHARARRPRVRPARRGRGAGPPRCRRAGGGAVARPGVAPHAAAAGKRAVPDVWAGADVRGAGPRAHVRRGVRGRGFSGARVVPRGRGHRRGAGARPARARGRRGAGRGGDAARGGDGQGLPRRRGAPARCRSCVRGEGRKGGVGPVPRVTTEQQESLCCWPADAGPCGT